MAIGPLLYALFFDMWRIPATGKYLICYNSPPPSPVLQLLRTCTCSCYIRGVNIRFAWEYPIAIVASFVNTVLRASSPWVCVCMYVRM